MAKRSAPHAGKALGASVHLTTHCRISLMVTVGFGLWAHTTTHRKALTLQRYHYVLRLNASTQLSWSRGNENTISLGIFLKILITALSLLLCVFI
jgi:hypothetical protein